MDKPHKKLKAWQLAMDIAEKIYSTTDSFPIEESLVSQMRRCVIRVLSNIVLKVQTETPKMNL